MAMHLNIGAAFIRKGVSASCQLLVLAFFILWWPAFALVAYASLHDWGIGWRNKDLSIGFEQHSVVMALTDFDSRFYPELNHFNTMRWKPNHLSLGQQHVASERQIAGILVRRTVVTTFRGEVEEYETICVLPLWVCLFFSTLLSVVWCAVGAKVLTQWKHARAPGFEVQRSPVGAQPIVQRQNFIFTGFDRSRNHS